MKKSQPSLDGFIPRRPGSQIGELHNAKHPESKIAPIDRSLHSGEDDAVHQLVGEGRANQMIGRSDIDESLQQIDDDTTKPSRRQRKKNRRLADGKVVRPRRKVLRIIKWVIISLLILAVLIGGYVGLKALLATHSVFKGSLLDLVQNKPLKQDSNGRSNFLILGTSEDDPGHDAGNLTDSILILSVDQTNKNAYMFSIPRDLYVQYGQACPSGYSGKINVYFSCVNTGTTDADEQDRLTQTEAFIGNITGIDIQYGVHVNYTVMRDVVNAIGGSITVDVQGDGATPAGIPAGSVMDSNFDWKCGATLAKRLATCAPRGHFIDYAPGPQVMDAEHALYFAQARGDIAPTWGLVQSNFDRERNQQKVLLAIKDKATSSGTLTNLGAVTGLIDALGSNLRTNIQTNEVRTLMDLGTSIKTQDIKSIDLYSSDDPQFTTGTIDDGESVVMPIGGLNSYTGLQTFLAKKLSSNPIVSEAANITVLNGSGVTGAAQTVADSLTSKGYTIDGVSDAPDGTYAPIEIYEVSKDKTATAAALKTLYNVTIKTTAPPVSVTGSTDFVIIVGPKAGSSSPTSN